MIQQSIFKKYAVLVISFYLISAYIIPPILISFFDWHNDNFLYIESEVELKKWIFPIFVCIYSFVVFYFIPSNKKIYTVKIADSKRVFTVSIILILINVVFLFFNLSNLSDFRYADQGISESSTAFIVLYQIGQVFFDFFVFSYIFLPEIFFKKNSKNLLQLFLMISGLFMANTGLASTLFAILASILMIISKYSKELLFKDIKSLLKQSLKSLSKLRIRKSLMISIILMPILILLLWFGWLYGNSVKMNVSFSEVTSWSETIFSNSLDVLKYLVFRYSPDYYSLRFALENYAYQSDFNVISEHFLEPIRTALFRFDVLTGGFFDIPRPEYGSLSRINLTQIAAHSFSDREGTSPGPITGFLYCFPFPFNFLFFFFYLLLMLKFFEIIFKIINKKINVIGLLFFTYFMRIFFMSPLDILTIFDTSAIYLVVFIFIYYACVRHSKRNRSLLPF